MTRPIYLDNNATTAPAPQVVEAVAAALRDDWANPSSVHRAGQSVRRKLDLARERVAALLGTRDREIIFTSGATEANNLALRGITAVRDRDRSPRKTILTSLAEHSAVREPCEQLEREGYRIVRLGMNRTGLVDPDELAEHLNQRADQIAMVSVHWANNETGVIQPIERIGELCRSAGVPLHTDATQAVGKLTMHLAELPIDAASFSAHKFHGPKGVGGLYLRSATRLRPQLIGGPQERERRGGTENVPAILGMATAAELAATWLAGDGPRQVQARRDRFETSLVESIPDGVVNAAGAPRLGNTANIAFPPLEAEALLILLSEQGVYASAGAACSSGSLEPSPILLAMGLDEPVAHGSLRFSLSRDTSDEQIDQALSIISDAVSQLRQSMPVG